MSIEKNGSGRLGARATQRPHRVGPVGKDEEHHHEVGGLSKGRRRMILDRIAGGYYNERAIAEIVARRLLESGDLTLHA